MPPRVATNMAIPAIRSFQSAVFLHAEKIFLKAKTRREVPSIPLPSHPIWGAPMGSATRSRIAKTRRISQGLLGLLRWNLRKLYSSKPNPIPAPRVANAAHCPGSAKPEKNESLDVFQRPSIFCFPVTLIAHPTRHRITEFNNSKCRIWRMHLRSRNQITNAPSPRMPESIPISLNACPFSKLIGWISGIWVESWILCRTGFPRAFS